MLRSLADWIASTPVSAALQNALWVVPTSQSMHLLAIGAVFGSAVILDLRLLGIGRGTRSISELTEALLPWLWRGLIVLLLTGIVQLLAEPGRQLKTPHFLWKMAMVLVISGLTWKFQSSVRRDTARAEARRAESAGDSAAAASAAAKLFALLSLVLWVAIIVCGRLIAYVWERYE